MPLVSWMPLTPHTACKGDGQFTPGQEHPLPHSITLLAVGRVCSQHLIVLPFLQITRLWYKVVGNGDLFGISLCGPETMEQARAQIEVFGEWASMHQILGLTLLICVQVLVGGCFVEAGQRCVIQSARIAGSMICLANPSLGSVPTLFFHSQPSLSYYIHLYSSREPANDDAPLPTVQISVSSVSTIFLLLPSIYSCSSVFFYKWAEVGFDEGSTCEVALAVSIEGVGWDKR